MSAVRTESEKRRKYRRVTFVEKNFTNRPVRTALRLGVAPKTFALLETRGRKTRLPRLTPVGNGLIGDVFWLVAEHGHLADYVKNIKAHPNVRVKVGRTWRNGKATILPDDDAYARSKSLPHKFDAALARALGGELLSIRIDLESDRGEGSSSLR